MELLKEAFIEGYKQRAESSDLIFDNASRMYAISLFDKWKSEQLLLHVVTQRSELVCDCLPMSTQVSTINGRYICCTCNKPLLSQACG